MNNPFRKAERSQVFLKLAITGPTGSGKTFSALRLAVGLIADIGKRIAFLDTENDSASLYSDQFDFDVMPITPPFPPESFATGINAAVAADYGCVIIDSASHFWKGILTFKDQLDSHGKGNSYTNWKDADKKFDPVIDAVLQSKIHVIFCMRSKMDYVLETDSKGKQVPKKVGLAPIMRDGLEYEFSTVLDIGLDHSAQSSKDRTGLFPNDRIFQVTEETGKEIAAWLKTAKPKPEPQAPEPLSDEEAKAKNVAKLRKLIIQSSPQPDMSTDIETMFCDMASALHEDNHKRGRLEDFTLVELRHMMPDKYKPVLKQVVDLANAGTAAK